MLRLFLLVALLCACSSAPMTEAPPNDPPPDDLPPAAADTTYALRDRTATHLPSGVLNGRSMDARPGDVDGDGDLDLVIATEFGQNRLLLNDGAGSFSDATAGRLPTASRDSEDIALADFDGDGDLDLLFVSEDDQTNEFYLNDGSGTFAEASDRLPTTGTTNGVLAADLDGDGDLDVVLGNAGQNVFWENDGSGQFTDATAARLPAASDITQDLEAGDVDGDGDLDLIVGNEDDNRLLLNDGTGVFTEATAGRLPLSPGLEETREADFGDVDADGDLDLVFANVSFQPGKNRQNRLLLNDGAGVFADETADQLPQATLHTGDADLIDLDGDGDLDLLFANAFGGGFQALTNDGTGHFTDATSTLLPSLPVTDGIDSEAADFNGDGRLDLYFCNYGQSDRLLLSTQVITPQ